MKHVSEPELSKASEMDRHVNRGGYVNEPFAITAGVKGALVFRFGGAGGR